MNSTSLNGTSYWSTQPFLSSDAIFIIIAFLIILFNGSVLFIMWKNKGLQSSHNGLLASLAVSDLSSGLIGIPLSFACTYVPGHSCGLCSVSYYFFKFISISTVLHILTIIAERCFLIVDPIVHRRLRAAPGKSNLVIIATIWSISLVASSVPWIWVAKLVNNCDLDKWNDKIWNPDSIYELSCLILFFIIPLVLISIFLSKIFIAVHQFTKRKSKRCVDDIEVQTQLRKTEMRIFIVLLSVFVLFIVCWLPYFVSPFVQFKEGTELPVWLHQTVVYSRFITSLLNPFVYAFYKDDIYQAMKRKVRSWWCLSNTMESEVFSSRQRNPQVLLVPFGQSA